jgi:RNA recognition motif-containing protein
MRLYIGNLPWSATEQDVRAHFEQHGVVNEVKLMTDRESGRPRGFGFVGMDDDGGNAAIGALDGQEFGGRRLTVNVAKERSGGGGGGGGRGYEDRPRGGGRESRRRDSY